MLRRLGIDISGVVYCLDISRNFVIVWLLCSSLWFFSSIKTVIPSTNYHFQWETWTIATTLLSFWLCPRMVTGVRTLRSTASVILSMVSIGGWWMLTPWLSTFQRVSVLLWKANRNYSSYRLVIREISSFSEKCEKSKVFCVAYMRTLAPEVGISGMDK